MVKISDGVIENNGTVIGYYTLSENTLADIFLEEDYRQNNFGTDTVKQICKKIESDGYDYIKVVSVISEYMIKILENLNFKNGNDIDVKDIYDISFDIQEDDQIWFKVFH